MELSRSQKKAVEHGKGPALVLAGPGSGKTQVITSRVKYLIEKADVAPERILVITFSKAAAVQMRDRFYALCGDRRPAVSFGTFHAVFFRILMNAYHYTAESILREDMRLNILSELADRHQLEGEDRRELLNGLTSEISRVKNEQIGLENFYSGICPQETFRAIFRAYEDQVHREGKIDFDDMLVYTRDLLMKRKDILEGWQERFEYILIDEFQDINALQYQIIRMLAEPEDNLFAVGDDDQSIYRFRGARPEIMLGFLRDYPDAVTITLEENYRCPDEVIREAAKVIEGNRTRFPKTIHGVRGSMGPVDIKRFSGPSPESLYIVKEIREALERGVKYKDMAILTRTNTGGRYIAERLTEFQIPFRMRDAMPNLYDHWIAQDIFAYIRLGLGGRDRRDFLQIMNRPLRYISRECVDTSQVSFDRLRMWYEDKRWMVERLDTMEEEIEAIGRMKPFSAVNYIRRGIGYDAFLEEYAKERMIRKEDLLETAGELQEQAGSFDSFARWSDHIEEYRKELAAQKDMGREKDPEEDRVLLATLHSAKGLEFKEVFLPDVNEGVLPFHKAVSTADLEEERRLLYVGMTRAIEHLHILYVKEKGGKELAPSRFLK